jgi:hypothetical protein
MAQTMEVQTEAAQTSIVECDTLAFFLDVEG